MGDLGTKQQQIRTKILTPEKARRLKIYMVISPVLIKKLWSRLKSKCDIVLFCYEHVRISKI